MSKASLRIVCYIYFVLFSYFIIELSRSKADEMVAAEIRRKKGMIERRQEGRIKGRKQKERRDE